MVSIKKDYKAEADDKCKCKHIVHIAHQVSVRNKIKMRAEIAVATTKVFFLCLNTVCTFLYSTFYVCI